ncbi:MAG: beta-galactosidase [Chloroflexota bacterium]
MTILPLEHPRLGVAYYPEHWPESRWPQDATLLREAGITVARMMEFAWDKLEPRPGEYHFEWMDQALEVFQKADIQVVLCTPTAVPPPWFVVEHPELLRVDDRTGQRTVAGSRRFACANVPAYQEAANGIVTAVAKQWGQHKNVIGWQIDNEFGCHSSTRCVCDYCRAAFQQWCEQKYGNLDALNAAWGTQFWSATYTDWTQIPVPAPSTAAHNPSLLLDYRRFSSDSWVNFQRRQIEVLRREIGSERFITHNLMLKFTDIDYFELARDLDFVSYDNYLHGMSGPAEAAFNLDLMRGLKNRAFWVMEQQPGPLDWTPFNPPVPPGQVRIWTHQAIAHGAEAVCYFRERAVNIGQEQYHAGIMKHDGTPDRCWYEAKQVSEDLAKRPALHRPQAPVALMFDYQDSWTLELDPQNREFSYYRLALEIYEQLWEANIPVDIVPRDADLGGYEAVFVPSPALINEKHTASWRSYVEVGGRLVVMFRAGFKNQGNTWTDQPMPAGGLSDLLGVTVDEFISIPPIPAVGMRSPRETAMDWNDERGMHVAEVASNSSGFGLPMSTRSRYNTWAEILKPTSAEALTRYADGYYKDGIAATVNHVGKGAAYTVGYWGDSVIPRLIWQALDLKRHEIAERDSNGTLEVVRLQDEAGNTVELRFNHNRRTLVMPEPAR